MSSFVFGWGRTSIGPMGDNEVTSIFSRKFFSPGSWKHCFTNCIRCSRLSSRCSSSYSSGVFLAFLMLVPDKKSFFGRSGHLPAGTGPKDRFHGGEAARVATGRQERRRKPSGPVGACPYPIPSGTRSRLRNSSRRRNAVTAARTPHGSPPARPRQCAAPARRP